MTIQAQLTRTRQDEPGTSWDREIAGMLELLEENPDEPLTIADMRELGIHTPGQLIYALQLAGYDIHRGPVHGIPGGRLGYRLLSDTPVPHDQAPRQDPGNDP